LAKWQISGETRWRLGSIALLGRLASENIANIYKASAEG